MTNTFDKAIAKRSMLQKDSTKIDLLKNGIIIRRIVFYVQIEHEKNLAKKTFFGKQ